MSKHKKTGSSPRRLPAGTDGIVGGVGPAADERRPAYSRRTLSELKGICSDCAPGKGVTCLFSGEGGTGKTMAAEMIARELSLSLYRVDLSAIVSKYIGETEKNLERLFGEAASGGAILLFDEADALFGKRSEVRDSHDRYAGIEINYLLQRMEAYPGLVILATAPGRALDAALVRRFRHVVDFPGRRGKP